MSSPIPINVAVEDALTESLILKLLTAIPKEYSTRTIYNRGGNGYLRRNVNGFNLAARGVPFLVATDLDEHECPPTLIREWLAHSKHHNLLLRIAVRQSEAWVLADKLNFAKYLGVRPDLIPDDVEGLHDAKKALIEISSKARKRDIREDICPPNRSTRKVGPNYNARLALFVQRFWDPNAARQNARSLARTIDRLVAFEPKWMSP